MSISYQNKKWQPHSLLIFLFLLFGNLLIAQNNWEKAVTFTLDEENLPQAFTKITKESGFRFAYNPQLIDTLQHYSYQFENLRIDQILDTLLPDSIHYKVAGNHIILQMKSKQEVVENPIIQPVVDSTMQPVSDSTDQSQWSQDSVVDSLEKKDVQKHFAEAVATPPSRIFFKRGEWNMEFSSGFRSEVYQVVEGDIKVVSGRQLSVPPFEFNVGYGIQSNTVIEAGLAFVNTRINWKSFNADYGFIDMGKTLPAYSSLQIPVRLKYYIRIWKNSLSLYAKLGIVFQFTLNKLVDNDSESSPISEQFENSVTDSESGQSILYDCAVRKSMPINRFNMLYTGGVGFCYKLGNGIMLSVTGEYYWGMLRMGSAVLEYEKTQYSYPTYDKGDCKLLYHGDYWNVGIGISCPLKSKKKR